MSFLGHSHMSAWELDCGRKKHFLLTGHKKSGENMCCGRDLENFKGSSESERKGQGGYEREDSDGTWASEHLVMRSSRGAVLPHTCRELLCGRTFKIVCLVPESRIRWAYRNCKEEDFSRYGHFLNTKCQRKSEPRRVLQLWVCLCRSLIIIYSAFYGEIKTYRPRYIYHHLNSFCDSKI